MRTLFAFIGILFDILALIIACTGLYACIRPEIYYHYATIFGEYFETPAGRLQVAAGALVLLLLSLRGVFLMMFGRDSSPFTVRSSDSGTLSISISTLENVVNRIAGDMSPPADVRSVTIKKSPAGARLALKLSLDFSTGNLSEYTRKLDSDIRSYFQNSLGIDVASIDIRAVGSPSASTSPALPVPVEASENKEDADEQNP